MSNLANGLVTILIPNYNGMPYLEKAIVSCLEQSYDCEIMIVDNGSTDSSIEYVKNIQKQNPSVTLRFEPKRGISQALNTGLREIKTKYVARLDSDDEMTRDRMRIQLELLENKPEVIVVGSQLLFINEAGFELGESNYPLGTKEVLTSLAFSNPIAHPSVMYRREEVVRIGLYTPRYNGAEDLDLWIRCLQYGDICNLSLPLTRYRQHHLQVSKSIKTLSSEIGIRFALLGHPRNPIFPRPKRYLLNFLRLMEIIFRLFFWKFKFRIPLALKKLIQEYAK